MFSRANPYTDSAIHCDLVGTIFGFRYDSRKNRMIRPTATQTSRVNLVSQFPAPATSGGRKKSSTEGGNSPRGTANTSPAALLRTTDLSHHQIDAAGGAEHGADRRRDAPGVPPLVHQPAEESPYDDSPDEIRDRGPALACACCGLVVVVG